MRELPRNQRAIDAVPVAAVRQRFRVKNSPGLHLDVHPSGRRSWTVRFQIGKGRANRVVRWVTIGRADVVTLAQAAAKARETLAGAMLDQKDISPKVASPPKTATFDWLFEQWCERYAARHLRRHEEEKRLWYRDISPVLGKNRAVTIIRSDVAKLRDAIAARSPAVANKATALIGRVANWAVDAGELEANPATRLRRTPQKERQGRSLSSEELRIFLTALPTSGLRPHTQKILELIALLGQRRTEIAHMEMGEVAGDTWTIPKERTKNKRATTSRFHREPRPSLFRLGMVPQADICLRRPAKSHQLSRPSPAPCCG
jgi:hypothetical protein